ncbi:MAG: IS66 family insertion sequence element accessory protein TnpB [Legionellales bacterium]|nr:IS66 family insertion sequence element accessory protein TnpB [Legionellales bacterium]
MDFRKGIDGLSDYIHSSYNCIPTYGIYVFYNKNKDKIKILFWHGNGFVQLQKKLERNKFIMPLLDDKKAISLEHGRLPTYSLQQYLQK